MMTAGVLLAVIAVMVWTRRAAKRSGATGVRPYELIYLFFSSAFLGDCFETVFVWLTTGVLMSRSSLLYAPLSLVWGLGAVLATLTLYPLASRSAALLFTAGFAHALNGFFDGLGSSGATLTVALYVYVKERGEFGVGFAIAAILMVLTLIINMLASLTGRYFKKRRNS